MTKSATREFHVRREVRAMVNVECDFPAEQLLKQADMALKKTSDPDGAKRLLANSFREAIYELAAWHEDLTGCSCFFMAAGSCNGHGHPITKFSPRACDPEFIEFLNALRNKNISRRFPARRRDGREFQ